MSAAGFYQRVLAVVENVQEEDLFQRIFTAYYEKRNIPKNVILDKTIKNIRFGGTVKEFIIKNPKTNDIYFRETNYDQYARWADVKICVFGMIWIKQPNSCNRISNTQTPIYLD